MNAPALTARQRALADHYAKYALQFCAGFFFGPRPNAQRLFPIENGTITLVTLGDRQMGVTNHHVIQRYRSRVESGEDILCQIGNVRIDPLSRLVSESQALDLAVLDLNGVDAETIRAGSEIPCQFLVPRAWPPDSVERGQFVMWGGFPGRERREVGRAHFEFGSASSGASEVISAQVDVLTLELHLEAYVKNFGAGDSDFADLPGISGSPVMIVRDLPSGLVVIDLVGIIFEQRREFEVLRARPASLIATDGTINEIQHWQNNRRR